MLVKMYNNSSYTSVMSHRSGETEDTTIADLAVALIVVKSKQDLLLVLIEWQNIINC